MVIVRLVMVIIIPIPLTVPTPITEVPHSVSEFIVAAEATMVVVATIMDTVVDIEVMDTMADMDTVVIVVVANSVRTLV